MMIGSNEDKRTYGDRKGKVKMKQKQEGQRQKAKEMVEGGKKDNR